MDNHEEHKPLGINMEYICEVKEVKPQPKLIWQKIDMKDKVIKNITTETSSNKVSLKFSPIKSTDRSGYRCVAENVGGVDEKTFYLLPACKLFILRL